MAEYWSDTDAALGLAAGLARVQELEQQKSKYDYSIPERLQDDQREAAGRVREALAFLTSPEADD